MTQHIFERYEVKFLITRAQKEQITTAMAPYMQADAYGRSRINSLYFDTPDHRLIRRSLEKPTYKEKLRVRSYGTLTPDGTVFVELKKKYRSVVYKRRIALGEAQAMAFLCEHAPIPDSQIAREIAYFTQYYAPIQPSMLLSYEREAFYGREDGALRITFDEAIFWRETALSLCAPVGGEKLLDDDAVLMEIECAGAIPLWLTSLLSERKIYKTPFSKYGTAYRITQQQNRQGGISYVE